MSDAQETSPTPPRLASGRSAFSWAIIQFLLELLLYVVFVAGGLFVGVVKRPPAEQQSIGVTWIVILIVTISIWVLSIIEFKVAAYRERAGGYTTMRGDDVEIILPGRGLGPVITLFSTADLWQLDPKTGAVIRRPGRDPDGWT
jgi:hypothetical protein